MTRIEEMKTSCLSSWLSKNKYLDIWTGICHQSCLTNIDVNHTNTNHAFCSPRRKTLFDWKLLGKLRKFLAQVPTCRSGSIDTCFVQVTFESVQTSQHCQILISNCLSRNTNFGVKMLYEYLNIMPLSRQFDERRKLILNDEVTLWQELISD